MRVTPDLQILQTLTIEGNLEVGREPDITFDGENYLVIWSEGEFGGESKVQASRITPSGTVLDTGIVCGMDHYCEYRPVVEFDGDRFLAIWYNYVDPPAGVFARFVGRDCIPIGPEFPIRFLTVNTNNDPDIAFCDSVYLVVWNEPSPHADDDVYGQIIAMDGMLLGEAIRIAIDTAYQYQARVCTADSMFIVVWYQNAQIYGQFIGTDGTLIGNNFRISDPVEHPRDFPGVAYEAEQFLAVWHEFINGEHDIYGNMDIQPGIRDRQISTAPWSSVLPTIMFNHLILPSGKQWRVFDITGRCVHPRTAKSGIYFVEIDGRITHKIILLQ